MVGRPAGTTKDPNRRRVQNRNGRLIDFEGKQYQNLIRIGYKLNRAGTKLIVNPNFTPVERRGRPKNTLMLQQLMKKYKIQTLKDFLRQIL